MDFAPKLPCFASDADATNPALDLHLNDIVAELRDRGITPRSNSVLRYALGLGLSEPAAADLAALIERRTELGETP
jgi:hypothetical protein